MKILKKKKRAKKERRKMMRILSLIQGINLQQLLRMSIQLTANSSKETGQTETTTHTPVWLAYNLFELCFV
jgi:hypothetical protein